MQIRNETAPDRHVLATRAWALRDEAGTVLQPELWLMLDGRIAGLRGAGGPAMHRWDLGDGQLVLMDRAGRTTARFADAGDEERSGSGTDLPARLAGRTTEGVALVLDPLDRGEVQMRGEHASALDRMQQGRGRRNLVVLHAGAGSAHADWTRDIETADRNWDLCIVWHDDPDGHPDDPDAEFHVVQHGVSKWAALSALAGPTSRLGQYDHVMVLDDDLGWSWSGVNLAFGIARDHELLLAHPAFDPAGRVERSAAVVDGRRRLRFATTIPTGAAMFSRDALAACLPIFGRGLDGPALAAAWVGRLGRPLHRIAILDEAPVRARARGVDASDGSAIDDLAIVGAIDRDWPPSSGVR